MKQIPTGILSLPNEVLTKIFIWGTIEWWDRNRTELPFPIKIGSICVHWHELSSGTPELWRRIFVPFSQNHIDCLDWVTQWLKRSAACTYSVVIDAAESTHAHNSLITKRIMNLLGQHSSRLRHLEVRWWSTFREQDIDIISPIFSVKSAPSLEFLSLIFVGGGPVSPNPIKIHGSAFTLDDTPKLSKVTLAGIQPPFILAGLLYVSLKSLQVNFDEIRDFFSSSPCLKTLVLEHVHPSPDPMPHQRYVITVPSLRELGISFVQGGTGDSFHFFGYCQFTNLEYLEIDGANNLNISELAGSIETSKIHTVKISNLTHDIFFRSSSTPTSYQFLHSMSNLRHIQLFNVRTSALFMNHTVGTQLERKRSLELRPASNLPEIRRAELPYRGATSTRTVPHNIWPKLHTITLDTLVGGDLAALCNFVSVHKNIRKIHLSVSSKRHLLHSVRHMDGDHFEVLNILARKWESDGGVLDAFEWLKGRVRIEDIGLDDEGLL